MACIKMSCVSKVTREKLIKGHYRFDMRDFEHELNWGIKWVIKGFSLFENLGDTLANSSLSISPKLLHLGW